MALSSKNRGRRRVDTHFKNDFRATPNEPIDRSNKIKFVQSMSLGYFLQDFAVLVHTRELGGTYQLLFHHSSAVFAYLLGMVSALFVIFKVGILSDFLKKLSALQCFGLV